MASEPRKRTPIEFVNALTEAVTNRLTGFGLDMDPGEAATVITKWAEHVTDNRLFERSAILYSTDEQLDELADSLVTELLAEIAEERPGTDPWAHDPIIPVPLPILLIQNTYLSLCADIALRNDESKWVRHATASIASITEVILEQVTRELTPAVEHNVMFNGEMRTVYGQIAKVPQPALAYLARFYENVVYHLERGLWELADSLDNEERIATLTTLTTHAALLRNLNERFGRPTGPRKNS